MQGDISLPRNPLVTKIFRVIDLAENAGYGFDKMFKGWRSYYHKDPVVLTGLDYYRIAFFFDMEATQKTTQKIIEEMKRNPSINRKELADTLGITEDGVKYHLDKLKKAGKIKRIGPDKGGHWEVV